MADSMHSPTATKAILAITWLFEVVMLWYFSTHTVNGDDNASVTARYETFVTPAGFAFSIWGLICVLQGAFVVYHCMQDVPDLSQRFITAWATCMVAGGLWSLPFDYKLLKTALVVMLVVFFSLVTMYQELFPGTMSAFPDLSGRFWLGKAVIPLHLAWISVATIINIAMVLTDFGWTQHSAGAVPTAVIVMAVGAVLAMLALWRRNDVIFTAVFIWAFYAIRAHQDERIINGAATAFAALLACALVVQLCSALFMSPRGFVPLD